MEIIPKPTSDPMPNLAVRISEHSASGSGRWWRRCALSAVILAFIGVLLVGKYLVDRYSAAAAIRRAGGELRVFSESDDWWFTKWYRGRFGEGAYETYLKPLLAVVRISFGTSERHVPLSDDAVNNILAFPEAESVDHVGRHLSATGFRSLADHPRLRTIDLRFTNATDADVANLGQSKSLSRIFLRYTAVTGSGFADWPDSSRLIFLDLGEHTSSEFWNIITGFPELIFLACWMEPDSYDFLKSLRHLEQLHLGYEKPRSDEERFRHAAYLWDSCPSLRILNGKELGWRNGEFYWDEYPEASAAGWAKNLSPTP